MLHFYITQYNIEENGLDISFKKLKMNDKYHFFLLLVKQLLLSQDLDPY